MAFHDGQLTLIPGFFMVFPAIPVAIWILRRGAELRWTLLALLALVHVTAVIALTIFPIPIGGQDFYRQTRGMSEDNIVPFATIAFQIQHISLNTFRQLFGNMIVLTPLAIYGPGLWPRLRRWWWFALVALAFAVGIELTQYAGSVMEGFTYRVTDVDDAIMNATGAVMTFAAWKWVQRSRWIEKWGWLERLREPAADRHGGPAV